MQELLEKCPICYSANHQEFLVCKDYTISQEKFKIAICENCGFKFTNPRPDEKSIGEYYQSEDYISHNDQKKGLISFLYKTVRTYTLKQKVKRLENFQKKGNLLDIGCGMGSFLEVAQGRGWTIKGTEPDKKTRREARKRTNTELYENIFQVKNSENQFDAITMWHVLEHVHLLEESLEHIYNLLKKEATLIIAVPNPSSWDAQRFQENWAAYDVPRHLYHFSQENLKTLLSKKGFGLQRVYPMPFDAYYISLMSNKSMGKARYLKSFWQGYVSNHWAKQNQQNYSSLTYIFKKI